MNKIRLFVLSVLALAIISGALVTVLSAQPGSETDPVVSVSYLDSVMGFDPVTVEGGEELIVPAGRGLILLEGACKIDPPSSGNFRIVNVTTGEITRESTEMVVGNLYITVSENRKSSVFKIKAWRNSTVAVPPNSGGKH
ncbi:MAG: hypothetical protein ABIC40_08670 [bacterium]